MLSYWFIMEKPPTLPEEIGLDSNAMHREQALCRLALESEDYDTMSDEEWVSLCERTGKIDPVPAFGK